MAVFNCKLYGFSRKVVYQYDPITGVGPSFSVPTAVNVNFLGATRIDESIQTAAYEVNVGTLDANALPMDFYFQQLTVITFSDPNLSFTEVIVQPNGHFTINVGYTTSNISNALFF